jgi:HlyD family secretion protein
MKKLITALVFLLLAGGGVYAYYKYGRVEEKPQVIQALVSRGAITDTVKATGTLEALRTVNVGSQVSGTVQDLFADYNSIVKKGQVIAKLDPTLLDTQVKVQEANIDRSLTDIASSEVQLENDKVTLQRTQAQFDSKLVSQQALETAQLAVKTRQAGIDSSRKQIVQLQAQLETAKLNVQYCTIVSPIDGVVVQRLVDFGQTVQASMTTPQFFTIAADLTTLRLTAGVDEADIGKIRPGQPVSFTVDAYPQQTFRGVVDRVRLNASTQQNVVTYQVVANVANQDLKLRPSMTANLNIVIETSDDVLRVPNQALRFKPTADMYAALGLQAPTPGGRGQNGQNAQNTPGGANAAPGSTPTVTTTPAAGGDAAAASAADPSGANGRGANAQGGNRRNNGRGGNPGFGQGGNTSSMTPEQRQALMNQFGGGRNGRGGGRGRGAANDAAGPAVPLADRKTATGEDTDRIDDLFAPLIRSSSPGTVYVWDEPGKQLKRVGLTVGITDGQQSEVTRGDLQPGQQVVTGIIIPVSMRPSTAGNPLMGNQPRGGGPGGMTPGGAAGGGGRGGGGGGGGRGGN